jgi:hypothetical protein
MIWQFIHSVPNLESHRWKKSCLPNYYRIMHTLLLSQVIQNLTACSLSSMTLICGEIPLLFFTGLQHHWRNEKHLLSIEQHKFRILLMVQHDIMYLLIIILLFSFLEVLIKIIYYCQGYGSKDHNGNNVQVQHGHFHIQAVTLDVTQQRKVCCIFNHKNTLCKFSRLSKLPHVPAY